MTLNSPRHFTWFKLHVQTHNGASYKQALGWLKEQAWLRGVKSRSYPTLRHSIMEPIFEAMIPSRQRPMPDTA